MAELDVHELRRRRTFVHPLAALVTISLDLIWTIPELLASITIVVVLVACAAIFVVATMTVTIIQLFVDRESVGSAIAKGIAMGVVTAVPYAVTGTVVGGLILAQARRELLGGGN